MVCQDKILSSDVFLFPFGFINFNIFLNFVICCLFENLIKDNVIRPMFSQVLHRKVLGKGQ